MAKWLLALVICCLLSVGIWFATIWNNFAFRNGLIADDYLMPVSVLALLIVVLGINPLLRRFAPRLSFSRRWVMVICGVLFMAALPPSAGILRQLAFPLAATVERANTQPAMAKAYKALDPPGVLFPDSLEVDAELPVLEGFLDELGPDESIPWSAWVGPIASWSGFVLPWFVMMIALAVIMSRYWQHEEHVPFPLLTIFRSLTDVPADPARGIPAIFKSRVFWIGCGMVFVLHALSQGQQYRPADIPAIDLHWNLWSYFSEEPWRYLPGWAKHGRIFFSFVAVAYMLPNRTSASIWFAQWTVAVYVMVGIAYFPPYEGYVVNDARTGTIVAFSLCVVWLARRHLWRVLRCTVGRPTNPRDQAYKLAGWCFALGCVGMFAWFLWVRVPPIYAAAFVVAAVLATLTLMRVVAETGLPLFFLSTHDFISFLRLVPLSLRSLPAMYFGGHLSIWLGSGQRVCVGAVATQAMAMDKHDDVPRHLKLGGLFVAVLAVALVCGWLLILLMGYHTSQTPTGSPIAWWGRQQFRHGENLLMSTIDGVAAASPAEHLPPLLFGAALVGVLFVLCQRHPAWPLHPIGWLGAGTWCVSQIWPSIFLGWLIRNLLIQVGGVRLYNAAKPFFIGALMGELLALLVWSALAGVLALMDMEYVSVNILPY